jgi:elongation factor P
MLSYFELRKGTTFLLEGQPYEVLDFKQVGKAQDVVVCQTKLKNLINGKFVERSFKEGEVFEEADLGKINIKFVYSHRDKLIFSETDNPSKRFELAKELIGFGSQFLKANQVLTGITFEENIINVVLPIKVQLIVKDAPPGVKGERSQAGTKPVTLETGAMVNMPLFIKNGDIVEINTQTGEYVRRVE